MDRAKITRAASYFSEVFGVGAWVVLSLLYPSSCWAAIGIGMFGFFGILRRVQFEQAMELANRWRSEVLDFERIARGALGELAARETES